MLLSAPDGTDTQVVQQCLEVLNRRLTAAGVKGFSISEQGPDQIKVTLPAATPGEVVSMLRVRGDLEFRPVLNQLVTGTAGYSTTSVTAVPDPSQPTTLLDGFGTEYVLGPSALPRDPVGSASSVDDQKYGLPPRVDITFTPAASQAWTSFTGRLACQTRLGRELAIVVDDIVVEAPAIAMDVNCDVGITSGTTSITGVGPQTKELAWVLSNPLPVALSAS